MKKHGRDMRRRIATVLRHLKKEVRHIDRIRSYHLTTYGEVRVYTGQSKLRREIDALHYVLNGGEALEKTMDLQQGWRKQAVRREQEKANRVRKQVGGLKYRMQKEEETMARQRNLKAGTAREQLYGDQQQEEPQTGDHYGNEAEYYLLPAWVVVAVSLLVGLAAWAVYQWTH